MSGRPLRDEQRAASCTGDLALLDACHVTLFTNYTDTWRVRVVHLSSGTAAEASGTGTADARGRALAALRARLPRPGGDAAGAFGV